MRVKSSLLPELEQLWMKFFKVIQKYYQNTIYKEMMNC